MFLIDMLSGASYQTNRFSEETVSLRRFPATPVLVKANAKMPVLNDNVQRILNTVVADETVYSTHTRTGSYDVKHLQISYRLFIITQRAK
jgi:hypothetical protein